MTMPPEKRRHDVPVSMRADTARPKVVQSWTMSFGMGRSFRCCELPSCICRVAIHDVDVRTV
jgi:hypothetical protein